jgi:TRAP-type C4-dicarboxylate transport system substrate-binding protein
MGGTKMKHVTKYLAAGAVALGVLSAGMASAENFNLRFSSYLPPKHFATKLILTPFFAKIAEATNDTVTVQNFPGGQLADGAGTLNAVKTGIANMGIVQMGMIGETLPLSTVVEVPGAFTDYETGAIAYAKLAHDVLAEEEFLPNGARPVSMAILPQAQLVLAKKVDAIDSLDDLAGLKIRVPHAAGAEAITALGMVPVRMPLTETYVALERGTVDGVMSLTASVGAYKLYEVANTVTSNMALGSVAFAMVISEKDFQKMSPEQQEQVLEAGREYDVRTAQTLAAVNAKAEGGLIKAGMNVVTLSDAVVAEVSAALAPIAGNWVSNVGERSDRAAEVAELYQSLQAE